MVVWWQIALYYFLYTEVTSTGWRKGHHRPRSIRWVVEQPLSAALLALYSPLSHLKLLRGSLLGWPFAVCTLLIDSFPATPDFILTPASPENLLCSDSPSYCMYQSSHVGLGAMPGTVGLYPGEPHCYSLHRSRDDPINSSSLYTRRWPLGQTLANAAITAGKGAGLL